MNMNMNMKWFFNVKDLKDIKNVESLDKMNNIVEVNTYQEQQGRQTNWHDSFSVFFYIEGNKAESELKTNGWKLEFPRTDGLERNAVIANSRTKFIVKIDKENLLESVKESIRLFKSVAQYEKWEYLPTDLQETIKVNHIIVRNYVRAY